MHALYQLISRPAQRFLGVQGGNHQKILSFTIFNIFRQIWTKQFYLNFVRHFRTKRLFFREAVIFGKITLFFGRIFISDFGEVDTPLNHTWSPSNIF